MEELLKNIKTLAIVCAQFGDTGKGKFVDLFSYWADIIARGTGGDNAGHTICIGDEEFIFHLIPSGILHDANNKINIIGSGTVVYPKTICDELALLESKKLSYNNLKIAYNAKLILPHHILLDRLREKTSDGSKIGTTGKGIGPTYNDFYARKGLIVNDMLNKDIFHKKLQKSMHGLLDLLQDYSQETIEEIFASDHLENGIYYDYGSKYLFDMHSLLEKYFEYGKKLQYLISDTDNFIRDNLGKKNILLEGAQGALLSIDHGTYPYVTSSDATGSGLAKGVGLMERDIDLTLGIIKGFYMTRVGKGPFPSELGGLQSESWCNNFCSTREDENFIVNTSIRNATDFIQGIIIRKNGNEYGATTKRLRRTGWLDLPLLEYSSQFLPDKNIILTKLDVLSNCETINICYAYKYDGPDYLIGNTLLERGDQINKAIMLNEILENCQPLYRSFPGWQTDISKIKEYEDLPIELKNILEYIKNTTNIKPKIISVGPQREETIYIN